MFLIGFDLAFVIIYLSYLSLRTYGLAWTYHEWAAILGTDILAVGACLMFPRLAFVTLSDNLMILALRSMLVEFSLLSQYLRADALPRSSELTAAFDHPFD